MPDLPNGRGPVSRPSVRVFHQNSTRGSESRARDPSRPTSLEPDLNMMLPGGSVARDSQSDSNDKRHEQ
jgi:hypothetical protein